MLTQEVSVRKNVVANYIGQGWSALMGLAFVPVYIKYLGIEAFGLIGVFATLQACLTLLDAGLAPALSREMARYKGGAHTQQSIRDLLRSIETIYGLLTVAVAILVWMLSSWLAGSWLKAENLSPAKVGQAISVMGILVALRWWEGLYKGALQGLQQMVWLSAANVVLATLRWAGAGAVLVWVSPTVWVFFLWQGVVSLLSAGVFLWRTYISIPPGEYSIRFRMKALSGIWRFSGGLIMIMVLGTLLTQVDKVLLSRLLSLETFGYYMLAATVASSLFQLIYPLNNVMYPRFTELATLGHVDVLSATYHRACQFMSVLIIPPALTLAFFARPVLELWTQNAGVAAQAAPIVIPLVLGTLCYGFMNIPYVMQLAYGWTSLTVWVYSVAVVVIVPAIIWTVPRYGAVGTAYTWFVFNAAWVAIGIHFMHRRLLAKEKWQWYIHDIGIPLATTATVGTAAWWFAPSDLSGCWRMAWIGTTGVVLLVVAGLSADKLRGDLRTLVSHTTKLKHA
jgi:O-antigen/teichoic acid export membrane protein